MTAITEKWAIATNWTSCFGTELNSLTSANAVQSSIVIANGTAKDMFIDVSISLGSITSGSGTPFIGIYLYPLNQDGTTYADGQFSSAAAGPPPFDYFAGNIPVKASTAAVITGQVDGIRIPPGDFKLVLHNAAGANLASSANTVKYRSYNRSIGT